MNISVNTRALVHTNSHKHACTLIIGDRIKCIIWMHPKFILTQLIDFLGGDASLLANAPASIRFPGTNCFWHLPTSLYLRFAIDRLPDKSHMFSWNIRNSQKLKKFQMRKFQFHITFLTLNYYTFIFPDTNGVESVQDVISFNPFLFWATYKQF